MQYAIYISKISFRFCLFCISIITSLPEIYFSDKYTHLFAKDS